MSLEALGDSLCHDQSCIVASCGGCAASSWPRGSSVSGCLQWSRKRTTHIYIYILYIDIIGQYYGQSLFSCCFTIETVLIIIDHIAQLRWWNHIVSITNLVEPSRKKLQVSGWKQQVVCPSFFPRIQSVRQSLAPDTSERRTEFDPLGKVSVTTVVSRWIGKDWEAQSIPDMSRFSAERLKVWTCFQTGSLFELKKSDWFWLKALWHGSC